MSMKVTAEHSAQNLRRPEQLITAAKQSEQNATTTKQSEQLPNISLKDTAYGAASAAGKQDENNNENGKAFANPNKHIQSELSKANSQLRFRGTRCEFKYYDDINRVAIKVVDNETNEVVKEIPADETIKLIQKLWEFAGLLYDEKG